MFEMLKSLKRQVICTSKSESRRCDFVSGIYIPADVNTRRKAKGLLAIVYSRTWKKTVRIVS